MFISIAFQFVCMMVLKFGKMIVSICFEVQVHVGEIRFACMIP